MKRMLIAAIITAVCLLTGCSENGSYPYSKTSSDISSDLNPESQDSNGSSEESTTSVAVSYMPSSSADEDSSLVENSPSESLEKPNRIVLVGDSRTMHIGNYLYGLPMINNKFVDDPTPDGDYIMGMGGEGYAWLSSHILEIEERLTDGCALVVNMGVNGVPYFHKEIADWCNEMALRNKDRGIKVYFMSVNPVNDRLLEYYNYTIRNVDVIAFNSAIRIELVGVTYIDTYSVVADDILGEGIGTFDGLHYNEDVCRKIRDYTWGVIKGE